MAQMMALIMTDYGTNYITDNDISDIIHHCSEDELDVIANDDTDT